MIGNSTRAVTCVITDMFPRPTLVEAEKTVAAVIASLKTGIKKKKSVQLIGFGTFKVVNRKARIGINPKTQEKMKIKASKSVKFVCGKALKASL